MTTVRQNDSFTSSADVGGTDLFLCVFGGPTLYVFDKILVEVSGEGGGEGAGGPGR